MPTVGSQRATVLLVAVILASTSCDNSDNPPAGLPSPSSPSPATTSAPPSGELIPLPAGVEVDADWTPSGDDAADTAVLTTINVVRSMRAVMATGNASHVAYRDYVTGAGEKAIFDDFVLPFIDAGLGVAGTDRLFDFKVSDADADSATVTFCNDQSDIHAINRTSGATVQPTPPLPAGYRLTQTVSLTEGKWKVSASAAEEDVATCVLDR
ncbi:MAG: hypothetical protein L0Y54_23015 [Sporichthyaceae bacterium]|nr:hypothetical protein [Sporichthyaceae bacterium]